MNVLVLGNLPDSSGLGRWIGEDSHVVSVDTFEGALGALREQPFDIIISNVPDFVPFEELHFTEQAATLLDTVTQGVCVIDDSGEFAWANQKMLGFPQEIQEHVKECSLETFNWAQSESLDEASQVRGRRFNFSSQNNDHYELTATPVLDNHDKVVQVAVVIWDVTNQRRLQNKIDAIDQAGHELVMLDTEQIAKLDMQERLDLLEERILQCIEELLHFDNFAIFSVDQRTQQLDLVLVSGLPEDAHRLELAASAEGNGVTGYVASRGRSYICPDVTRDPRYIPGVPGARSSLTVPLRLHDKVIAVANFESTKRAAFSEDDRQFAEILGRYIAIALHTLQLLVTERYTTTGKLSTNVMSELTGPLNDILTDLEGLIEDYIGHDDIRTRLRAISENAVGIRTTIKDLTSNEQGLVGSKSADIQQDPVITGKSILIADDQDAIRNTVRDVLAGFGCDVVAASDGEKAIEQINKQSFDLVLSDIKMPLKNGYEVFAAAKDVNPKTAVILMTGFGYDPNHSIVRARREGLSAVLFKPFKVDQLIGEIRMALKPAEA